MDHGSRQAMPFLYRKTLSLPILSPGAYTSLAGWNGKATPTR